jgi:hypothetical protein
MLRENDFSFHIRLMSVPALISKLSIFLRYESQFREKGFARWTRMEDHDDRFEKIPQVLEQILTTKPPDTTRFYQRVLAGNITISLKSSQVFFLDNNTFLSNINLCGPPSGYFPTPAQTYGPSSNPTYYKNIYGGGNVYPRTGFQDQLKDSFPSN